MKILVTGAKGLVGSSIKSVYKEHYKLDEEIECIFVDRSHCNLLSQNQVNNLIKDTKPDAVIHTAARVGGIGMNLRTPAKQFYQNILMNTLLIHSCYMNNVKKLIAFSSVCVFPEKLNYLVESKMHQGEPYPAHRSYAYAKRMLDIQIEAYNSEYGLNYCSVIPGNIFGKRDNFNLKDGHVIPSLIHRCYLAKKNNIPFEVWGTGEPMREFIYCDDMARASIELIKKESLPQKLILSGQKEYKIKEVVEFICDYFNYYDVRWLDTKPNGQMRRPTSKEVFNQYLPNFKYQAFKDSLVETMDWFTKNYEGVRK